MLITEDMKQMMKRSGLSKFVHAREDPKKIAAFRQSMTAAMLKFNVRLSCLDVISDIQKTSNQVVRLVSIERKIDTLLPSQSSETAPKTKQTSQPSSEDEESRSFSFQVTPTMWPEFKPNVGVMDAAGRFFMDFTDSWQRRWANGEETGGQFGHSVFPTYAHTPLARTDLPARLFDLHTNRVVECSRIEGAVEGYTIISHVWGENVIQLDGSSYGVEWPIPIRRAAKLDQILQAARIIGGLRYVWLDVLCLDQRTTTTCTASRVAEMRRMRTYYANSAGCIIWLDNAQGGHEWDKILDAMEHLNRLWNMDKAGMPTYSVDSMINDGLMNMELSGEEALKLVRRILTLEKAPWFSRVWTLQEAVIPDTIYFCTPERYLVGGAVLFSLIGICGVAADAFTRTGSMLGIAITHTLQKSEVWKIIRLRQLWREGKLRYWHLVQSVRGRKARVEQDRVFGVLGLMRDAALPNVEYAMSIQLLYREMWKEAISEGDFHALCFIGEAQQSVPGEDCMGFIPSHEHADMPNSHSFTLDPSGGIQLNNIGLDTVTTVHPIITNGGLRSWPAINFLDLPSSAHSGVASAFGLPDDRVGELCPGSFAAMAFGQPMPPNLLAVFGKDFQEKYEELVPQGMLGWLRASFFTQATEDNAIVIIWTRSSDPQLAVVTSKVEGSVFVVTPSSYKDNPGEGCLICQLTPGGLLKKIGIGLGSRVKASQIMLSHLV